MLTENMQKRAFPPRFRPHSSCLQDPDRKEIFLQKNKESTRIFRDKGLSLHPFGTIAAQHYITYGNS
jgi:hypothetical protein